jgi:hypothetical protein
MIPIMIIEPPAITTEQIAGQSSSRQMGLILEQWRKIDGVLRAGGWAWIIFCWLTGLTSAVAVAWASTTWAWYWTTFSWAGVAAAFLCALLILAISFLLVALAVQRLRSPSVTSIDGRLALVSKARDFVSETVRADSDEEIFREHLESDKLFFELKPHLSAGFMSALTGRTAVVPPDRTKMSGLVWAFLGEIDRLEKQWQ